MSITIFEGAFREIEVEGYLDQVGGLVVDAAKALTDSPPGSYPHPGEPPYRRSGRLSDGIQAQAGEDAEGAFVDVGTDAISDRQGYAYPYFLEKEGFRYFTLALEQLDIPYEER